MLESGQASRKVRHAVSHLFAKRYLSLYHSRSPLVQSFQQETLELDSAVRGGVLAAAAGVVERNVQLRENPRDQAAQLSGTGVSVEQANAIPVMGTALAGAGSVGGGLSGGINVSVNTAPAAPPSPARSSSSEEDDRKVPIHALVKHAAPMSTQDVFRHMSTLDPANPHFAMMQEALTNSLANRNRFERAIIGYTETRTEQLRLNDEQERDLKRKKMAVEERKAELEMQHEAKRQRLLDRAATVEFVSTAHKAALDAKIMNHTTRTKLAAKLVGALGEDVLDAPECSEDLRSLIEPLERHMTAVEYFRVNHDRDLLKGAFIKRVRAAALEEFMSRTHGDEELQRRVLAHTKNEGATHAHAFPVSMLRKFDCFAKLEEE